MNEKKWRLIDDYVVVSLIYDFEVEVWRNEVMNYERSPVQRLLHHDSNTPSLQPVLDLANKTALPTTLQR